jgi:hypothetical protein
MIHAKQNQSKLFICMVGYCCGKHNKLKVGENHQTLIMFCHKIVIKIYLHANVGLVYKDVFGTNIGSKNHTNLGEDTKQPLMNII